MRELSNKSDNSFWSNKIERNKIAGKYSSEHCWYEMLLIGAFMLLRHLSIKLEWNFYSIGIWLISIFFFSWFSPMMSGPITRNPISFILQWIYSFKSKWLYFTLNILNIIFVFTYILPEFWFKLSIIWIITVWIPFFIGPFWLYLCFFFKKIMDFIHRAVKWEVNRPKIFKEWMIIIIACLLMRIYIKYDVPWLIKNRLGMNLH